MLSLLGEKVVHDHNTICNHHTTTMNNIRHETCQQIFRKNSNVWYVGPHGTIPNTMITWQTSIMGLTMLPDYKEQNLDSTVICMAAPLSYLEITFEVSVTCLGELYADMAVCDSRNGL